MPSYIPELVYGPLPGRYVEEYGLIPWPEHLRPRKVIPGQAPAKDDPAQLALVEAGGVFFLTLDRKDRMSIATTIERLIDMLDAMSPDCDLEDTADDEPSLGWPEARTGRGTIPAELDQAKGMDDREVDDADYEDGADDERNLGWETGSGPYDQSFLIRGMYGLDEVEEENEHGGDIQDEPHDERDEGDREPFLGWSEKWGQVGVGVEGWSGADGVTEEVCSGLRFDGTGYYDGREMLHNVRELLPHKEVRLVPISPGCVRVKY